MKEMLRFLYRDVLKAPERQECYNAFNSRQRQIWVRMFLLNKMIIDANFYNMFSGVAWKELPGATSICASTNPTQRSPWPSFSALTWAQSPSASSRSPTGTAALWKVGQATVIHHAYARYGTENTFYPFNSIWYLRHSSAPRATRNWRAPRTQFHCCASPPEPFGLQARKVCGAHHQAGQNSRDFQRPPHASLWPSRPERLSSCWHVFNVRKTFKSISTWN